MIQHSSRATWRHVVFPLLLIAGLLSGCSSGPDTSPDAGKERPVETGPVRVLVVDAPELARVIQRRWRANSEGEIDSREVDVEFLTNPETKKLDADVVIYPAGLIGELAQRELIIPILEEARSDDNYQVGDILSLERAGATWDEQDYAFTFGSPQLTLMYRADIFEALDVEPPRTWKQFGQLAELLDQREKLGELAPAPGETWSGIAEPRAAGWSSQLLLARAAAYVRHRARYSTLFNINSMKPLVDTEPFVKALAELTEAQKHNVSDSEELSPTGAYRALVEGRCAMAIGWPSAAELESQEMAAASAEIGFAELPGSSEVFNFTKSSWERRRTADDRQVPLLNVDGRIGSVTRESPRRRAAQQFLIWLTSKKNSDDISPHSKHTTMFRLSQTSKPAPWVGSQLDAAGAANYGDFVRQANERRIWFHSIRIPGRHEYLDALDKAVRQAVAGESPADALSKAGQTWSDINARRGIDGQREAYEQSLGVGR